MKRTDEKLKKLMAQSEAVLFKGFFPTPDAGTIIDNVLMHKDAINTAVSYRTSRTRFFIKRAAIVFAVLLCLITTFALFPQARALIQKPLSFIKDLYSTKSSTTSLPVRFSSPRTSKLNENHVESSSSGYFYETYLMDDEHLIMLSGSTNTTEDKEYSSIVSSQDGISIFSLPVMSNYIAVCYEDGENTLAEILIGDCRVSIVADFVDREKFIELMSLLSEIP